VTEPALLELLHGQGAHADPLACVEDLPAEIAGNQLPNFPYSIYQQLAHMNYWMDYELRRIRGQRPKYPDHAAESWPNEPTPAGEAQWRETLNRFSNLIEQYTTLAKSPPDELSRQIEPAHEADVQNTSTLSAILWQMAAHNSYHTGQIVLMRRVQGAWPPKGGGDTW